MKIVVDYMTAGSFQCGSYNIVLCFEYESTEAWLVGFDELLKESKEGGISEFQFCNQIFEVGNFNCPNVEYPQVLTLEEWFEWKIKINNWGTNVERKD